MQPLDLINWHFSISDFFMVCGVLIGAGKLIGIQTMNLRTVARLEISVLEIARSLGEVRAHLNFDEADR